MPDQQAQLESGVQGANGRVEGANGHVQGANGRVQTSNGHANGSNGHAAPVTRSRVVRLRDRFASVLTHDQPGPSAAIREGLFPDETYRRDATYRRSLALADLASAAIAVLLGVAVLGGDALNPVALLALPLVLLVGKVSGLYERDENVLRKTTLDEVPSLFWVATLYALLISLGGELIVDGHFSAVQAVGVWALLFMSLIATRALARRMARAVSVAERCLVLGDADTAAWLARRFAEAPGLNARVVGRVPLEPERQSSNGHRTNGSNGHAENRSNGHGANGSNGNAANGSNGHAVNGFPAFGDADALEPLLRAEQVERAIIAPRGAVTDDLLGMIRRLKSLGVKVSVLPRLFEVVGSSVELDDVDGITLLGMRRYGLSRSSRAIKRALDLVGAGFGLVVLSPVLAVIATAVKLDSRGPVLFRQRRMGRDNVPFEMFKFRTMVDGADAQKAALAAQNEAEDGLFKIKDDPRITRVGRLLRHSSLDELPQLLNVMRGDMALVGPRPLVLDEDSRIEGWQRSRLELSPGMTGPWQVFGSARIPLQEMVKIDYLYGANWSLWLDVKLLLRTVPFVLGRRGL